MTTWQFLILIGILMWIMADLAPIYHVKDAKKMHDGCSHIGGVLIIIGLLKVIWR